MITATQSPIQQAESIFGSPYLPLHQLWLHQGKSHMVGSDRQLLRQSLELGLRQAIAVHNEALLESIPTPDVDLLMQVVREQLMADRAQAAVDATDQLDDILKVGRRLLQAFLSSDHARPREDETIVSIEHDVSGFIADGVPPVRGQADLVTMTSRGVVVINYRIIDAEDNEQAVNVHAGELHLIGALLAGSIDDQSRLAGLRLVTITSGAEPTTQLHRIHLDESRLRSIVELIRSTWYRIVSQHS